MRFERVRSGPGPRTRCCQPVHRARPLVLGLGHESGTERCDIHRIAGQIELRSSEPDAAKAEAYFERALAVAREQQAKSWELRAAMSMARLWRDQGKREEARELLAPVYGWFTESFKTLDLKEAEALLDDFWLPKAGEQQKRQRRVGEEYRAIRQEIGDEAHDTGRDHPSRRGEALNTSESFGERHVADQPRP